MRTESEHRKFQKKVLSPQSSFLGPSLLRGGARSVALAVLLEVERGRAFADEVLDRTLNRTELDARDRALVYELVYGVLRYQATLDWRLEHLMDRRMERVPTLIKMTLRLGAYQVLYLQKIPHSAAVNEAVLLVKPLKKQQGKEWSGFVNAVLRALTREQAPPWPDPNQDPVTALSVRYSCPPWLTARWVDRLGADTAATLCQATCEIPPLTIRVNTLRQTREKLAHDLIQAGHQATPTAVSPVGLVLEKCGPVTELPRFHEGAFYVEDEAAQLVAPLLDPQPGERVLDACAAPGGKSTHLAALMQNRGEIVAMDRNVERLRLLEDNCRRLGVTIVTAVGVDATLDPGTLLSQTRAASAKLHPDSAALLRERPFDRILVDAPCSGLGVLRRHPEGKWRKDVHLLEQHHATQVRLLDHVSHLLRPGGVLVYSTCSTEPEENEHVIDQFCHAHGEFRREPVAPWLPPSGLSLLTNRGEFSTISHAHCMDLFFAARLRKAS